MADAMNVLLEFEQDDNAVTIFEDGKPLSTGHGDGRAAALLDLWTTLQGMKRDDLVAWVGRKYRILSGHEPKWPNG